jgi:single-stranded-DNA-specific exonuclease
MASKSPYPDATWRIAEVNPERVRSLSRALRSSRQLSTILLNRGIEDAESAQKFLRPDWADLHDPFEIKDMREAVARIRRAVLDREPTLVFGDYDVDGITATTVLHRLFSLMDHPVTTFIPDRITEGYGLNRPAAERIVRSREASLVVTVDCGVSDIEGVRLLKENGIDVIITDHHVAPPALPPADALVNPKRLDCDYPFKLLAGVGVAFKLAWAIATEFSPRQRMTDEFSDFLLEATGLVALGTVCDVVPLVGENRVLVAYGLKSLASSPNPGLRALLDVAGVSGRTLEPKHLGFKVGPRINAAGRMGCPEDALALLAASSFQEAIECANRLDRLNGRRQSQERAVLAQVNQLVETLPHPPSEGIVLAHEGWSPGITGTVASRLVDAHGAPCVLIAVNGDQGRGSGRSIPGLNLLELLAGFKDRLLSFGGHARAVGFSVSREAIDGFVHDFGVRIAERLATSSFEQRLVADCEVRLKDITHKLLREIEMLRPHGEGNPPPLFVSREVKIPGHPKSSGRKRKTLRFLVNQELTRPPIPATSSALRLGPSELKRIAPVDLAYVPKCVFKSGQGGLELNVLAARPVPPSEDEAEPGDR